MKKKALVIYNPVAGKKKFRNTKELLQKTLKKEGYEHDFFETKPVKKQPLDQFLGKKYDRIIVSGGDGTVSEVTSFLIENKIKTPLVIIPQGSANILAISLLLPLTAKAALLRGLKKEGKALDAMKINEKHYSMIAAGLGYDSLIMEKTPRHLKRTLGFFAYVWTILKTFIAYRNRPFQITIDGKRERMIAKSIMTFNLLPLGQMKISRPFLGTRILPNDGKLNVFSLKTFKVRHFQGKKISIKTKKARRYQVDGEVFKGKSLNIEVLPKAIYIAY